MLAEDSDAPAYKKEVAELEIIKQKELVKRYETAANEHERKLNQEGLFGYICAVNNINCL